MNDERRRNASRPASPAAKTRKEPAGRQQVARYGSTRLNGAEHAWAFLTDGSRVFPEEALAKLAGPLDGALESSCTPRKGDRDAFHLVPKAVRPFLPTQLLCNAGDAVVPDGTCASETHGPEALPLICRAWMDADEAGALDSARDRARAREARRLLCAFARVGAIALANATPRALPSDRSGDLLELLDCILDGRGREWDEVDALDDEESWLEFVGDCPEDPAGDPLRYG